MGQIGANADENDVRKSMVATVEYVNGAVRLIDQRRLPTEEVFIECRDYQAVAEAIRTLAVRGPRPSV